LHWQLRTRTIDLDNGPVLMGIVNLTPDSFSDGGQFYRGGRVDVAAAVDYALQLVDEGAAIIDLGAESTRPSSQQIDGAEELRRIVPVVAAICEKTSVSVSVDSYRAATAREAIAAGAEIVNDISAATFDAGMLPLLCESNVGVCLMHMQGTPQTMQQSPQYDDVVAEVATYLTERKNALIAAGISPERITLDPGIGFGKNASHNLRLLREVEALHAIGPPLLYGISRKRFVDALTGCNHANDPKLRLSGTLAATLFLAQKGVQIFRTHDVAATKQAIDMVRALQ